jgi:CheY-like chemotaxis protein
MPGLTGREVQRRLSHARISLPIIVVTAYNQATVREQCLADGAAAYLAKPLQCERLVGVINAALRLARKV